MKPPLDLIRAMLATQSVADVTRTLREQGYRFAQSTISHQSRLIELTDEQRHARATAGMTAARAIGRTGPADPDRDARVGSMKLLRRMLAVGQHNIVNRSLYFDVTAWAWREPSDDREHETATTRRLQERFWA